MQPRHIIIAPLGEDIDALFIGIRSFPTEKIILVPTSYPNPVVQNVKEILAKFKIPVEVFPIKGNLLEGMFKAFAQIKEREKESQILVNVATGDKMSACAALSAAFVNGWRAFSVDGDEPIMLPVLKFSYYKILSDKKIAILSALRQDDRPYALEELREKVKMSLPLLSYHINGNRKSEGLQELGLVESSEKTRSKIEVKLTQMGRLLAEGSLT
jgi:hypothetical protein